MKRFVIPALSILLLAGVPAHAAPGDGPPGQDENANKEKQQQRQERQQSRPPAAAQRQGGQRAAPVHPQRGQPALEQRRGYAHQPQPAQPAQRQQVRPAERQPVQQAPAMQRQENQRQIDQRQIDQRQNDQRQNRQGQGESGQRERMPQNPPAAQRQAPPRDQRQGNVRTERYAGPRDYTPGQRPRNLDKRPRQFDARDYRHNYQAEQRYHWRPYERPRGWYQRRWVYGEVLPQFFWAPNYLISDFWMFGLAIPPYGYEWVRYGDDALLVSTYNGQILQVVYGVFY